MPTVQRSLTINAPPQKVYDAFVDFGGWLKWNPHLRQVQPVSEGPLAPGFKARVALKLSPIPGEWEVTEVQPGRSFAWAASIFPGLRLLFDHIAESADGGTLATLRIDMEGPLALAAGLAGAVYGRNLDRSLRALKEMLEAGAAPAPAAEQQPATAEPEAEAPPAEAQPPAEEEPQAEEEPAGEEEGEGKNE